MVHIGDCGHVLDFTLGRDDDALESVAEQLVVHRETTCALVPVEERLSIREQRREQSRSQNVV